MRRKYFWALIALVVIAAFSGFAATDAPGAAVYGTVTAYIHPRYATDSAQELPLPDVKVLLVGTGLALTDVAGNYLIQAGTGEKQMRTALSGLYLRVENGAGETAAFSETVTPGDNVMVSWIDADSTVGERDLYYHLTAARRFARELDTDFNGLDMEIVAIANADTQCLAKWDGAGFSFSAEGGGCKNMSGFADLVYQQYGQAMAEKLYEGQKAPTDPPGRVLQAMADYFSATLSEDPELGENVGTTYSVRNIGTPDVTVSQFNEDPFHDALPLAGSLWDMRANLIDSLGTQFGRQLADDLYHFARYDLPENEEEYLSAILKMDDTDNDLTNGTPHSAEIIEAFGRHGIGPGIGIEITDYHFSGDNDADGFPEPGESFSFWFAIFNRNRATDNMVATLSADSDKVTIDNPEISLPYVGAWAPLTSPESFALSISEDAVEGEQVVLSLTVTDGEISEEAAIYLTLGEVAILMVDDDGGRDYELPLTLSLAALETPFALWDIAESGRAPNEMDLARFPIVIWSCGGETEDTLTESDQELITDYLDSGGSIFINGQGIMNDIGSEPFIWQTLLVHGFSQDIFSTFAKGVANDPISKGLYLKPINPPFARKPDTLIGYPETAEVFLSTNNSPIAIRYPITAQYFGQSRFVFFAFPFEGIDEDGDDPNNSRTVLDRVLNWLQPNYIVSTSPTDGEQDVGVDEPMVVKFKKPMSADCCDVDSTPDTGQWEKQWNDGYTELTLTPQFPLTGGGISYVIRLENTVDAYDNPIEVGPVPHPWSFLTAYGPTLFSVTPDRVEQGSAVNIILTGANFVDPPMVYIGQFACGETELQSESSVTVRAPATIPAGTYDLKIINPDSQTAVLEGAFTVTENTDDDDETGDDPAGDGGDDDDDDAGCGCGVGQNHQNPDWTMLFILILSYTIILAVRNFGLKRLAPITAKSAERTTYE